jgi:hypothetical protein
MLSVDLAEIYVTRRCHMGTNIDFATILSPLASITMFFFKDERMLGSYPNLHTLGYLESS